MHRSVGDDAREGDSGARDRASGRLARKRSARAILNPVPAWRRWLAVVLAVGGIALLLWLRAPIAQWLWPDTRAQQLRADAAKALEAGDLTRVDGRGARELYEAALAVDPDRADARAGLVRVGQAALTQAEVAVRNRRYADARRALQLARELDVPRARVDALAAILRERETDGPGVERLLSEAAVARNAGRLDDAADSALMLYQRVLLLQPNNTTGLEGREDTLADLLQRARQALELGELGQASRLIRRVREVDPGHYDLPEALAVLSEAADLRLRQAEADLRRGRLPQALAKFDSVVEVDPDNAAAAAGRLRVASVHALRSERHAADFRFDRASSELRHARAIAPESPAVVAAQTHLARARQSQARLESTVPVRERQRRVRQLLKEAAIAEARGDLLSPPGSSAFDKVSAARAIAPQDRAVLAATARLQPAASRCFEQALRNNRLTAAGNCLDALTALAGGGSRAVRDARSRLAQRWIAFGDERLGAGELEVATRALQHARTLDQELEGLDAFADRLDAAAVVGD